MNDSNNDRLVTACEALVKRLTASMPRESDEQKQQLLTLAVSLEQAFMAGVSAQRDGESLHNINPQRLTGDWAQSVPVVRAADPSYVPYAEPVPSSTCAVCGKGISMIFASTAGPACFSCAANHSQPVEVGKND